MTSSRVLLVPVSLLLVPLLLTAGCGGGEQAGVSPTPGATATVTEPAETSPGASAPPTPTSPVPTSTQEVAVERAPENPPLVIAVRFAAHDGYDRVVIDLNGPSTGYSVRWVDELVQDGSGDRIEVEGGAFLQVNITPAHAHTDEGKPTWVGGPIFQAELGNVSNVVKTGDFEGVVGVGIVMARKTAFHAFEQRDPNRLVIDVAH
jgi:hypothetical protein